MPALPWFTVNEPTQEEVLVMASRLELKSFRHIPAFFKASMSLLQQARRSQGAIAVSLKAHLTKRTFWTVSAWTDKRSVHTYAATEPHKSAMPRFRPAMKEATFVFWTASSKDLPITWNEVSRRVAEERQRTRS